MNGFTPPGTPNAFTQETFLLGTDDQGRDVFSTILYGLRISLFVGTAAVLLAMIIGVILGLVAAYFGGYGNAYTDFEKEVDKLGHFRNMLEWGFHLFSRYPSGWVFLNGTIFQQFTFYFAS